MELCTRPKSTRQARPTEALTMVAFLMSPQLRAVFMQYHWSQTVRRVCEYTGRGEWSSV